MNVLEAAQNKGSQMVQVTVNAAKGPEWHGPCPGCGGTDRFHIWPDQDEGRGSYWCRPGDGHCGKAGDAIQFFRDFDGMSFKQAAYAAGKEVSDMVGFRQDAGRRDAGFVPRPSAEPIGVDRAKWEEKAEAFVKRCHRHLVDHAPETLRYLADRGVDAARVEACRVGLHSGENGKPMAFRDRQAWGLPRETRPDGKLKRLWLPRGLVIPWMDLGRVIRIKIRRPEADRTPQFDLPYYFVPGGLRDMGATAEGRKVYVIVEAELDAMAVDAAAGDLVAAVPIGTSSAKPGPDLYDRLLAAHKILVATDAGDAAGAGAARWWLETFRRAVRWPVPRGKDPGDAIKAGVSLRKWILAGLPPSVMGNVLSDRFAAGPVDGLDGQTKEEMQKEGGQAEQGRGLSAEGSNSKTEGSGSSAQCPGGEAVDGAVDGAERPSVPASLTEFFGYLRKYPVQVYHDGGVLRLVESRTWRDWKISREISQKLFFDSAVRDYVCRHPSETIHKNNFWDGLEADR